MTDQNKSTGPGDDLDDAWARAGGVEANAHFGAVDTGGHYSAAVGSEDAHGVIDPDVIDVAHAPVKKGRQWLSYLIMGAGVLVGIGALAGVGMFIYNQFAAGDVPVEKPENQTLPHVVKGAIPGVTDATVEPGYAPGSGQFATLDAPQASAPSPASSASVPVATTQASVETTVAAPVALLKASAMQPAQEPPSSGNASQVANVGANATATSACEPVKPKAKQAHKVIRSSAHEKATNVASAVQKKRAQLHVSKRTPSKSEKMASKTETAQSTAVQSGASSSGLTLKGFVIISIWPKSGEFQQAALKDASGKNYIVHTGDSLNGYRVLNINADEHVVKTDAGVIR